MSEAKSRSGLDANGLRQRKPPSLSNESIDDPEVNEPQAEGKKPLGRTPDGQSEDLFLLFNSGPDD